MINFIETTVARYPNELDYHRNKDEDRVRKTGVKGSLWIKNRKEGFSLQTTSSVASLINKEIEIICGNPVGENRGYKYWYLNHQAIEKIFEILARI
jgi:hypothetical protein